MIVFFHFILLLISYIHNVTAKIGAENKWNLNDKVVVVTGGSKGIGQAIISECLALNTETVITCCRNQHEMDKCKRIRWFRY